MLIDIEVGMVIPPAAPIINTTSPSFINIDGLIEESGRFPPSIKFVADK